MKKYLYNPKSGAPIKNWYDGSNRWSLGVDEVKAFPLDVAEKLAGVYGFLQVLDEDTAERRLEAIPEPAVVEVAPTGELVPKSEEKLEVEKKIVEVKKEEVKELIKKVKKATEAKPSNPAYEDWSRGELISECHKRNIEIKGLGKSVISSKRIISLLENDDAQKE